MNNIKKQRFPDLPLNLIKREPLGKEPGNLYLHEGAWMILTNQASLGNTTG